MGHPHRVLIVDDERTLLGNLARAVKARGWLVDTAEDGHEALRSLERKTYDVVVTDLRMPGLAGADLMDRIEARGQPVRVLVMTGHATLEAAVDCLRKGAVDFLVKPFDVETFLLSLARALKKPLPHVPEPDWEALAEEHGLTHRETDTLRAFHETGHTNAGLADTLSLSTHTVKSHLKAAFLKMGVRSRAELLRALRTAR